MTQKPQITPTNVFFYYPNLVGYSRVIMCTLSYIYAFHNPTISIIFYFLGAGFDAVDGVAARYFNQCSKFGTLLDMLTDRMGTLVLLIINSHQYPDYWGVFAFLIVLDIVSHWVQMYVTLLQGKTTHKGSENPWLNFYYTFPYALLVFCSGNELFIMCMYLLGTPQYATSTFILYFALVNCPLFIFKQAMNVVQFAHNVNKLVDMDVRDANLAREKLQQ